VNNRPRRWRPPAELANCAVHRSTKTTPLPDSFRFPRTPLVVFAYNPFGYDLMKAVLRNLSEAYAEEPHPIWFIYRIATQRKVFEDFRFLQEAFTQGEGYHVYCTAEAT